MARVVCIGNAVVDRIYRISAFPRRPTKVRAVDFMETGGGTAANTAACLARLGVEVELWSRTGDDDLGVQIRRGLHAAGVDTRYVQPFADCRSSSAVVIVDDKGERLIVSARDVNLPSDTSWLPLERLENAGAVVVDLRWLEAARLVLARAKELGIPTIIDSDFGSDEVLGDILPLTDYAIFPQSMLGDWAGGKEIDQKLKYIAARGPVHAGVTLGENGYRWYQDGSIQSMPAFKIDAVDTTGAGDAFHGGFVAALIERNQIPACVRFASAVAALKCRRLGARAGLPSRDEAETFLSQHPVLH